RSPLGSEGSERIAAHGTAVSAPAQLSARDARPRERGVGAGRAAAGWSDQCARSKLPAGAGESVPVDNGRGGATAAFDADCVRRYARGSDLGEDRDGPHAGRPRECRGGNSYARSNGG